MKTFFIQIGMNDAVVSFIKHGLNDSGLTGGQVSLMIDDLENGELLLQCCRIINWLDRGVIAGVFNQIEESDRDNLRIDFDDFMKLALDYVSGSGK